MRAVVTGGAGFIGANLVSALAGAGHVEVVVVDDLSTGHVENLTGIDHELVEGTILDAAVLDKAFEGADAVVHLAARGSVPRSVADPVATHRANASGTVEVLEAARRAGNPYLVLASSSSVYGGNPALPKREDQVPMPLSPYAASKLALEGYAQAYAASYGLELLALRFFNVFGPLQAAGHDYAAVVPAFCRAALAGAPLPIHGDGHQTRDFTFVGSVVAVLVDAVRRRVTSPAPVNLAFGSRRSILEVADDLERVVGRPLGREHEPPRVGDARDTQADAGRLRELFPESAPTPFEDGLAATWNWWVTRP